MSRVLVAALMLIGVWFAIPSGPSTNATSSRGAASPVGTSDVQRMDRRSAPGAQARRAVSIAAGNAYTCAVTSGGSVECWGADRSSRPAPAHPARSSVPVRVGRLRTASSVSIGLQHTCAVLRNGTVECWGSNGLGQLGDGSTRDRAVPVPVRGLPGRAVAVTAGLEHTCALLKAGDIECWGAGRFGQLGDGSLRDRVRPVRVRRLASAAVAISAGGRHTCAVLRNGGLECWGADYSGQLGDGKFRQLADPVRVRGVSRAVGVSAGYGYTCVVVRNGAVNCWGANAYGQLGDGTRAAQRLPRRVRGLSGRAVAISAGVRHTCALMQGGAVACWGANDAGQLGNGTLSSSRVPVLVSGLGAAVMVSTGPSHTCALTKAGGVRCWGMNASGELGAGTVFEHSTPMRVTGISGAVEVSAGDGHTCARTSGGTVNCWGANTEGQLGNRTRLDSSTPVPLSGLSAPAKSLAAGGRHTCAVTTTEAVECWGSNDRGQLGDGNLRDRQRAVVVRGLSAETVRVTAGENHTCALSAEGTVRCWGDNTSGQLGDGTRTRRRYPAKVRGLENVTAISAGGRHTCAVTATGDAACWGANDWGQLGTGKPLARSEPARVTGLAGAAAGVAIGANHTCALLRPGGIECWGANDSGQLGTGKLLARSEPVRVTELAGAAAEVTSGDNHTCARMRHGRVWCWGANDLSQLGAGKFRPRRGPVMVRGLTIDQVAVGAGGDHTCSITGAGSVACWGWNYWGQLGNAAPPASGSPTPVDAIGFG